MIWKKRANWFKGAIVGLVVGLFVSLGLVYNNEIISRIASPGYITCQALTNCNYQLGYCAACNIVGLIFNLIYGFVIGALFGWLIDKILNKESNKKIIKTKKKR